MVQPKGDIWRGRLAPRGEAGGQIKVCKRKLQILKTKRSDISKLDCTGQKVDNLRNRWAHFKVEEPCNSVTLRYFAIYC